MPNKTVSMSKIRQILRCYAQGKGSQAISSMLGVSRNTIKKYLQQFQTLDLSYEQALALDDCELSKLFHGKDSGQSKARNERLEELEALLPDYCKRLKKKGITRQMLHTEYLSIHPDGYGRSRFNTFMQCYIDSSRPIMHLEHKAGDKLYIDFAGDKQSIVDVETGEIQQVEIFVGILPCSQLTYVEALRSQKKEDLIKATENALLYFEGVPQVIVPDNLKAAVTRGSKYEALAEHYGCTVIPARAYKPRDKALVEGAVKLIYRSIYPKLEGRTFHDLTSINAAIRVALERHNNTPFSGRNYSRREQFEEIERNALGALNPIRYEIKKQALVTVMKNGHIRLSEDSHYYSVPYQHIGKRVKILYTSTSVEVFFAYEKIAEHVRSYTRFKYTSKQNHLASNQRSFTEWSG
ncbi:hypothetical protein EZS27_027550 [termite gut metagenome]|uniref:Integrase catalytic domain-containing protein n=1 Tax=termite gut metagenome TaxID=433724 RepID=A0A5J4QQ40_9ZZZZ